MEKNSNLQKLSDQIKSFRGLWKGGYFEGEVLDPIGNSSYSPMGYMNVLHVLYLIAIKQYVNPDTVGIEIGPGRGAFSKAILSQNPRELWCMDAVPPEETRFFDYVGQNDKVKYITVNDFSCSMLPDNHFDYLFSFGALCHISFEGVTSYLTNLYPKLKSGANGFIMVADYDKFNACVSNIDNLTIYKYLRPQKLMRFIWKIYKYKRRKTLAKRKSYPETEVHTPGRWYHSGIEPTCALLESLGYKVISKDLGVNHRDPVIHFKKV